jgi:hypothetical protein
MDLTNAYLHADIQDRVFIYIPQGFPGAGEVTRLDKATYGTKQGARRFYDHTIKIFTQIGFTQCFSTEPCLCRYLGQEQDAAFLILYVDDALISGSKKLVQQIETKLKTHFDCNFAPPKDFLGLDVHHDENSNIRLSMKTYTSKVKDIFNIPDTNPIHTPGRTDRKITRGENVLVVDNTYRSKIGSLSNVGKNGNSL